MNYTEHLNLPQWEGSDRIDHEDFNEAMEKIDEAVKTTSEAAADSHFAVGVLSSYNGSADVSINLGRQPSIVVVGNRLGFTNIITTSSTSSRRGHAVALPGYPGYLSGLSSDMGTTQILVVTATGFTLKAGLLNDFAPFYYLALFE